MHISCCTAAVNVLFAVFPDDDSRRHYAFHNQLRASNVGSHLTNTDGSSLCSTVCVSHDARHLLPIGGEGVVIVDNLDEPIYRQSYHL